MTDVRAAAVYARISSDSEGLGLGVARQVEDCRGLADRLGWAVAEEYVDNDVSAYSGKRRPAYERMLTDIADGLRDAVIVYHLDRLTRRPMDLEQFASTMLAAGVRNVRFVHGDIHLGTDTGMLTARMLGAVAAQESGDKSRRLKRKMQQNAAAGLPHGGAHRPYGYAEDKVTVREDEAAVFRILVARVLAGESLRSLATWMDTEGISTVSGTPWRTTTLKGMLTNPRYAGLRTHNGVAVGPAVWEPIISEETHSKVLAHFAERARSGRRPVRRYLLSGLLRCGRCENRLFTGARKDARRYVCMSGPDHGGCGRLTVVADPLERFMADAVLTYLDTPQLHQALAGRTQSDGLAKTAAANAEKAEAKMAELADMWADGEISRAEWRRARDQVEKRLTTARRTLARATQTSALDGLVGNGDALRGQWASLSLDRQHAIVAAVLDHAVIGPGTPGSRSLDIGRVQPVWRA